MTGTSERDSKVERVLDRYDHDGVGAELEARWLGEGGERESLRDLADWLNRQTLAAALARTGADLLDGEIENLYRLLRDAEATSGMETSARRRLERNGVDVEAVERDFVSHQAVHTYLRERRGAELPTDEDPAKAEARTIRKLRNRTTAVTENSLDRLAAAEEIDIGEHDVFTRVQVLCGDCGSQYDAAELVERGGCDCDGRNHLD